VGLNFLGRKKGEGEDEAGEDYQTAIRHAQSGDRPKEMDALLPSPG